MRGVCAVLGGLLEGNLKDDREPSGGKSVFSNREHQEPGAYPRSALGAARRPSVFGAC